MSLWIEAADRCEPAARWACWEPDGGIAIGLDPGRPRSLAALEALEAELLRHDSATLALERWCRARGGAPGARVVAEILERRAEKAPAASRRLRLRVGPTEVVRYRRVRLRCGGRVLSEAENWYVPGRLSPEANRLLESTDIPFGRVVQGLRFLRRPLAAIRLWRPAGGAAASVPPRVLRHRALLVGADGTPFSEVVETYTRDALFLPDARP